MWMRRAAHVGGVLQIAGYVLKTYRDWRNIWRSALKTRWTVDRAFLFFLFIFACKEVGGAREAMFIILTTATIRLYMQQQCCERKQYQLGISVHDTAVWKSWVDANTLFYGLKTTNKHHLRSTHVLLKYIASRQSWTVVNTRNVFLCVSPMKVTGNTVTSVTYWRREAPERFFFPSSNTKGRLTVKERKKKQKLWRFSVQGRSEFALVTCEITWLPITRLALSWNEKQR